MYKVLEDRKRIVLLVAGIILFLFCFLFNIDTREEEYIVSPLLQSGDIIEQEVLIGKDMQEIGVLFATYATVIENGSVNVELLDMSDNIIVKEKIPANLIKDNQYLVASFENVELDQDNQIYKVRMVFEEIENETISIWLSDTDDKKVDFFYNGGKQKTDIVLNTTEKEIFYSYKDIRLYYIFAFVLVAIYLILYKIQWQSIDSKLKYLGDSMKGGMKKKVLLFVAMIAGALLLAAIMEYFIAAKSYVNPYRMWLIFVVLLLISVVIIYKKYIWKYSHCYFFMVVMLIGSVNIFATSSMLYLSWDDQIHFERTLNMSYGGKDSISIIDKEVIDTGYQSFLSHELGILQKDIREEWKNYVNEIETDGMIDIEGNINWQYVAYVPASISLCIGRILGFEYTTNFIIGKFVNLLCYAFIMSLSIKVLQNRGKILVGALGLIPTMLYMATAYAYDWWVYSLIILGFSIFIGEIQKTGVIRTEKMIQAVGIMTVGMLPKAVYFPILFPLMLMRKEKYTDSKKCRGIVLGAMILLLASFILPIFLNGAGTGDSRGGVGVNSSEQIKFILNNIETYIGILLNFLKEYLSPDQAFNYLSSMAYLGIGKYYTVCMLVLCTATILDNDGTIVFGKKEYLTKLGNYIGVFGALVLTATALYISFTAVASETIAGCQHRYILPVLFSILFFVGECKLQVPEKMKEKLFVFVINAMSVVFLIECYDLCISLY